MSFGDEDDSGLSVLHSTKTDKAFLCQIRLLLCSWDTTTIAASYHYCLNILTLSVLFISSGHHSDS